MTSPKSFRQLIGLPPSTASINDSTLIIIDAQNEYASGHLATVNVSATRAAIAALLAKYRSAKNRHNGANIVHVLHETPAGAPVFTPNTELAQEFEELRPTSHDHQGEKSLMKTQPSAFAATELDDYLQKLGNSVGRKLVLCGYMAHVCVSTTARQAAEKGYEVLVAEDAVGDRDIPGVSGKEVTRVALAEVADAFGTVIKGSEIGEK